jgi:hypothetical protein
MKDRQILEYSLFAPSEEEREQFLLNNLLRKELTLMESVECQAPVCCSPSYSRNSLSPLPSSENIPAQGTKTNLIISPHREIPLKIKVWGKDWLSQDVVPSSLDAFRHRVLSAEHFTGQRIIRSTENEKLIEGCQYSIFGSLLTRLNLLYHTTLGLISRRTGARKIFNRATLNFLQLHARVYWSSVKKTCGCVSVSRDEVHQCHYCTIVNLVMANGFDVNAFFLHLFSISREKELRLQDFMTIGNLEADLKDLETSKRTGKNGVRFLEKRLALEKEIKTVRDHVPQWRRLLAKKDSAYWGRLKVTGVRLFPLYLNWPKLPDVSLGGLCLSFLEDPEKFERLGPKWSDTFWRQLPDSLPLKCCFNKSH